MRIRLPFAGVFFVLLVIAGYAGLTSLQLGGIVNDKVLHVATFFLLTVVFYWIVDTNRRRTLNMALVVCTFGLGVGSELLQAAIPNNGREFDAMDIVANIAGSLAGLGLCSWYHKRMLERKRLRKYSAVPGDEGDIVDDGEADGDVELGEGIGIHHTDSENGAATPATTATAATITTAAGATPISTAPSAVSGASASASTPAPTAPRAVSLEEELDNWDENAEDDAWGEADGDIGGPGAAAGVPSKTKKRID